MTPSSRGQKIVFYLILYVRPLSVIRGWAVHPRDARRDIFERPESQSDVASRFGRVNKTNMASSEYLPDDAV
jgi:hypothetical protein